MSIVSGDTFNGLDNVEVNVGLGAQATKASTNVTNAGGQTTLIKSQRE